MSRRWPGIRQALLIVSGSFVVVFALAGVRYQRFGFPAAAGIFAALPLAYAAVSIAKAGGGGRRSVGRYATVVVVLAALAGGSTYLVATSCRNRLGPGADLSECDLANQVLQAIDLHEAKLTGAVLSNVDLSKANLRGADLTGADLRDADLTGADLHDATLARAVMSGAALAGAELAAADLSGADLTLANLADASMAGSDLSKAMLDRVALTNVRLDEANLTGAIVLSSDLRGSTLDGADLTGARLERLKMEGVTLIRSAGVTDAMLAKGLDVSLAGVAETLIRRNVRIDTRDGIRRAAGAACRGAGVAAAAPYPSGVFHPMVIGSARGDPVEDLTEPAWEPMGLRFAQLVACVGEEEERIVQTCPYRTLDGRNERRFVTRIRSERSVRVVAVRTGAVVSSFVMQGSEPGSCPQIASTTLHQIGGERVEPRDVLVRLGEQVR